MFLVLILWIVPCFGIETFSEYWQRFDWEMMKIGPVTISTYMDFKTQNHFKNLHYLQVSEQFAYEIREDLDVEFHYSYIHDSSIVPHSLWKWQHRFEVELNKTFADYIETRNRLEVRRIEKNPKMQYRFRQRTALVFPICGILYKVTNEIFYDFSKRRVTQDRFSPLTLSLECWGFDLDLFFLVRYLLHDDVWYRSMVLGSQLSF